MLFDLCVSDLQDSLPNSVPQLHNIFVGRLSGQLYKLNHKWRTLWSLTKEPSKHSKVRSSFQEIEDITWPLGDTNFIFECCKYERYFQHSKIKFLSPRGLVMFCLFYRDWWNSYIKHNFFYSFSKQQNSAIKVITYRKMPVTILISS